MDERLQKMKQNVASPGFQAALKKVREVAALDKLQRLQEKRNAESPSPMKQLDGAIPKVKLEK